MCIYLKKNPTHACTLSYPIRKKEHLLFLHFFRPIDVMNESYPNFIRVYAKVLYFFLFFS